MRTSISPWNGERYTSSRDHGSVATQPAIPAPPAGTTLLYQIVERHYPEFRDIMAAQIKALPLHVQQEFAEYLKCGRLEHGFVRVQCSECQRRGRGTSLGTAEAGEACEIYHETGGIRETVVTDTLREYSAISSNAL